MDEEADLALLDQHLLKTNLLSQRMTSILGQLDTRLSRLDKTIAPLGLQPLTRKAANIDAAIASLSGRPGSSSSSTSRTQPVPPPHTRQISQPTRPPRAAPPPSSASSSRSQISGYSLGPAMSSSLSTIPPTPIATAPGTPADETAILTRGPDIMALGEYFSAMDSVTGDLERMYKGLMDGRGGAREAGVNDLGRLVEVGMEGLVGLALRLVGEGSGGRWMDVEDLINTGPPTPSNLFPSLPTLLPLTSHLSQYLSPTPSTRPKTAEISQPVMDRFVSNWSEVRGGWMKRSLEGVLGRVEESDEGMIWDAGREKVGGWVGCWEGLMVLAEAETLLLTTLFPSSPPSSLLHQTLQPSISAITNALSPTINSIKRSPSTQAFIALELYQSLTRFSGKWDQALRRCLDMLDTSLSGDGGILTVHNGTTATLRQLNIRSFPELLVDTRSPSSSSAGGNGPTAAISPTTYSTLTYLETLPNYQSTVESLLSSSQSQRSWLMGSKDLPSPVRDLEAEGGIVNLFVADVLGTLIIHLNQRTTSMRRPIGQTFLLNNLSHVRNATASFNSDIIGPGAEDMLNRAYREAKSQYISEWSTLTSPLTSHPSQTRFPVGLPSGNSERQHLKETATQFFDKLGEMEQICTQYPLSRGDPDLRDRVGREVVDMVGSGWRGFTGRCSGKGLEKYIRVSPEEIIKRVQAIFR